MRAAFGRGGAVRWRFAAVASALLVCVIASSAAAATPPDRATLAQMDDVIRGGMDGSGVPGFSVAVVSGDDVVHARCPTRSRQSPPRRPR